MVIALVLVNRNWNYKMGSPIFDLNDKVQVYEAVISYGRGVTISEAIGNVVNDQTALWAENRTPH